MPGSDFPFIKYRFFPAGEKPGRKAGGLIFTSAGNPRGTHCDDYSDGRTMRQRLFFPALLSVAVMAAGCSEKAPELIWQQGEGYRVAALSVAGERDAGFEQIPAAQSGITFRNSLTEKQIAANRNLLNGSGVAAGDVDGDGLVDLYFCRLDGANVLYRNLGNWKFEDITAQAGVQASKLMSTGAVFADIEGDGDLDLLLSANNGPNALFINDGSGRFRNEAGQRGFRKKYGSTTIAFADIDNDGDLDIYLTNYKKISIKDIYPPQQLSWENTVEEKDGTYEVKFQFRKHFIVRRQGNVLAKLELAEEDLLFINDGTGHFSAEKVGGARFLDEDGAPSPVLQDWGLTAKFHDVDSDGDADLYVCNDFWSPDRFWINRGDGTFQAIDRLALRNTSISTMSVDFADIDADGDTDFFLPDMLSPDHKRRMMQMNTNPPLPLEIGQIDDRPQYMQNTLFLNRGDLTFAEIARYSGVDASEWSWAAAFLDADLDGFEDILITTGHPYDIQDSDTQRRISRLAPKTFADIRRTILLYPQLRTHNFIFRNNGDLHFTDKSADWGFRSEDIAHGLALADLDNDGDLDVVMNRYQDEAGIYENLSSKPRVAVRLRGENNTAGIGAKVLLRGPSGEQIREIGGGTYLSSSQAQVMFAARDTLMQLEVRWPGGKKVSRIESVRPNQLFEIYESGAEPVGEGGGRPAPQPLFTDATTRLGHVHTEQEFDDFRRQPLLPRRLSQNGPALLWFDANADGFDDLLIGSGRGGRVGFFLNQKGKRFRPQRRGFFSRRLSGDAAGMVAWQTASGEARVAIAVSGAESSPAAPARLYVVALASGQVRQDIELPPQLGSPGPLAMADYDGDGDLDLFVGGRFLPGRYPQSPASLFLKNENGRFAVDEASSRAVAQAGMVSGAVFAHLDEDSRPELVLAVEWGPVRVYSMRDGVFREMTDAYGLAQLTGWWQGVATGDFDGDGHLDLIATNRGLNSVYQKYAPSPQAPLRVFHEDFDNNGIYDLIEAYTEKSSGRILPIRRLETLAQALPIVRKRFRSFSEYGQATVADLLGERKNIARELQAVTLASQVLLNRGGRFEAVPLPAEAQFAPAFSAAVADIDGDGHEDIFLSQNFFAHEKDTPREDAGLGLWLLGDGTGRNFHPLPAQRSGVRVYGEQRGAAPADFDNDGRIDLAVSQNGTETRLLHGAHTPAGVRVRVIGSRANPAAIGARLRPVRDGKPGPVREISAGSGYWSQQGGVQVFHGAQAIEIIWPDGHSTRQKIPRGQAEIVIRR